MNTFRPLLRRAAEVAVAVGLQEVGEKQEVEVKQEVDVKQIELSQLHRIIANFKVHNRFNLELKGLSMSESFQYICCNIDLF